MSTALTVGGSWSSGVLMVPLTSTLTPWGWAGVPALLGVTLAVTVIRMSSCCPNATAANVPAAAAVTPAAAHLLLMNMSRDATPSARPMQTRMYLNLEGSGAGREAARRTVSRRAPGDITQDRTRVGRGPQQRTRTPRGPPGPRDPRHARRAA